MLKKEVQNLQSRVIELEQQLEEAQATIHTLTQGKKANQAPHDIQLLEKTRLLELEQARLAAILENLPVGIWIADEHGQLVGKNKQADQIWAGEAPLSGRIEQYQQYVAWYPESGRLLQPEEYPVAIALRSGKPVEPVELKIRRFDGSEGTVLVSAAPIGHRKGQLMGVVGVNVDITDRQQAEKQRRLAEERYTTLFNSVREGFAHYKAVYDDRGKFVDILVVEINPAGAMLSGIARENQVGKTWRQMWPGVSDELFALYQRVDETGEILRFDDDNRLTSRIYDVVISKIADAEFIATFNDITERRRAEDELQESERRLKRSNQDLQDFASIAAHELQEPLRKIVSFGELLQERAPQLDDQGRDYIERMRSAAGRMRNMVDGLLQLSRVATKGSPLVQVDLSQVIADVLSDLEDQIRRTKGRVNVEILPVVHGDPLQLRQLMQNLIANALKYHHPDTPPDVKVYAKQQPGWVQIFVEDKGIGFEQEDAEHIFQSFVRLVGRSQYEGSGMGLAICRRIVERHGGEIAVHSRPGQGATFIVKLPVRDAEGTKST